MTKTNISRMVNTEKEILLFTTEGSCITLPKGKAVEQLISFLDKNKETQK